MHQQYRLAAELDHARISQQLAAGLVAEALAEHEVAVAVHQIDSDAALAQRTQGAGNRLLERRHGVVANPDLEEVTENVQGFGLGSARREKMQERPGDIRAFLFQMQI